MQPVGEYTSVVELLRGYPGGVPVGYISSVLLWSETETERVVARLVEAGALVRSGDEVRLARYT